MHMDISFRLNGEDVTLRGVSPTQTVLDWLREERGLKGTKEGCNEGDCGACTVMVSDEDGARALNACILFLPQLQGKALRTVEGLTGPDGELHPVQEAMITHHGAQCGFCTPGVVMSLAAAHGRGDPSHDDVLAGNLCRCTGYAPIIRAAETAAKAPVPDWLKETMPAPVQADGTQFAPQSADDLAKVYAQYPEARLVAGATDVGLWVTKGLQDLGQVIFVGRCKDLQQIEETEAGLRIGAGVNIETLRLAMGRYPSFQEMLRRFASTQVRMAATIGGNIANGSPIGDAPPPLIALGAILHLRQGEARREILLEDFFIEYGKQDRRAGEFIEAITIPSNENRLRVYKLSKRFDQDISALCGAFNIIVEDGRVAKARIAFGGMAGTPKRALAVEAALIGQPWSEAALEAVWDAWEADFQPLSDLRATAGYRMSAARGMLSRYLLEDLGMPVSVLEVEP